MGEEGVCEVAGWAEESGEWVVVVIVVTVFFFVEAWAKIFLAVSSPLSLQHLRFAWMSMGSFGGRAAIAGSLWSGSLWSGSELLFGFLFFFKFRFLLREWGTSSVEAVPLLAFGGEAGATGELSLEVEISCSRFFFSLLDLVREVPRRICFLLTVLFMFFFFFFDRRG